MVTPLEYIVGSTMLFISAWVIGEIYLAHRRHRLPYRLARILDD